jgi:type I restriction enzyme R subunit
MTTGVDAKLCKLIVLENNINSMTEFKQIIGRGTRLLEEYGKTYFSIIDFRNSSRLFADPNFDGDPKVVIDITEDDPVHEPFTYEEIEDGELDTVNEPGLDEIEVIDIPPFDEDGSDKPKKYYIGDVTVSVLSERVQYVDKNGKLITESLIDYTKKNILHQYSKLDVFLKKWSSADKKQAIIEELQDEGVILDAVREELGETDLDDFDLICHIAYDKKPLTKKERAENVKKRHYLYKYSDTAQAVISALLDKYANDGIKEIEETKILQLKEFAQIGSPMKIVKAFGGKEKYLKAVQELENEIYYA